MPNSQTRKKSNKRSPKKLTDLEWLANPYEQLKRATSFNENDPITESEFLQFFEEIGEIYRPSKNRSRSKNKAKTKKSKNKNKNKK